jgi:AraC-like DNA-binding protein
LEINIVYTIVIAAILQGFWLSFFILSSKKFTTKAAIFLGLLILVVTITQLQYGLGEMGIISWKQFNVIYLPIEFLEAPFLYFFVVFYLVPASRVRSIEKALFIPFVFFLANTLLYKSIAFTTSQNWEEHSLLVKLANLNVLYGDFVNILSLCIVLSILLYKLVRFQSETKTYDSKSVLAQFVWLKVLLLIILLVLLFWGYYAVRFYLDQSASYLPVDIVVSILIYVLGYIGIHKLNILNERKQIRLQSDKAITYTVDENSKNNHSSSIKKVVIGERKFLDPTFSAEKLAEELQLSKSHLSRIFNAEMNISFSDYTNSLRVEEAKKHLQNPEFANYTLVAIGLEAGFNSKTTFNTTFKKLTGQTPSQFRENTSN